MHGDLVKSRTAQNGRFTVIVQFKREFNEHWPFRSHRMHTYFHPTLHMKDVWVFPPKKHLAGNVWILFYTNSERDFKMASQTSQTAYKCNVSPVRLPAHYRAYKQHRLLYGYFSGCVTNKEPGDLLFRMFLKSNVLTSQWALCQSILPSEELWSSIGKFQRAASCSSFFALLHSVAPPLCVTPPFSAPPFPRALSATTRVQAETINIVYTWQRTNKT